MKNALECPVSAARLQAGTGPQNPLASICISIAGICTAHLLHGPQRGNRGCVILRAANESPAAQPMRAVAAANEFVVLQKDSLHIPFGDFWNEAIRATQRFDMAAANAIIDDLNTVRGKLLSRFIGLPVYLGHPDVPGRGADYPDKKVYARFRGAEIAADNEGRPGLKLCPVKWSSAGWDLIENGHFAYHSPYWDLIPIGNEGGRLVARPVRLHSLGLTNWPVIPVSAIANEAQNAAEAANAREGSMDLLQRLIALLGLGKDGADAASEDGVISTVSKLLETAKKLKEEIEARWNAQDAAFAAVPNEAGIETRLETVLTVLDGSLSAANEARASAEGQVQPLELRVQALEGQLTAANEATQTQLRARAELMVDGAIAQTRINADAHDTWVGELVGDFSAANARLEALTPRAPGGEALTLGLAGRETGSESEATPSDRFMQAVNERRVLTGEDHHTAWRATKKTHKTLWEEANTKTSEE